jgi:hypothetical protein
MLPALPILKIEPALPMLRIEPALPMLKTEPALPMLMMLPTLPMLKMLLKLGKIVRLRPLPGSDSNARFRAERAVWYISVLLRPHYPSAHGIYRRSVPSPLLIAQCFV